jgi:tripartite-type tricarboxylate transporter receptor subunit TctC
VISGQIQLAFATALTAKPQVDAGRVRALAVSGPKRVEALPNVPPVGDAVPGYEAMQWYGFLAPAGTPAAIIERLNGDALVALRSKEMKDRLAADGAEPLGSSPAQFGAFIRRELDKWNKVAEAAKIEKQ